MTGTYGSDATCRVKDRTEGPVGSTAHRRAFFGVLRACSRPPARIRQRVSVSQSAQANQTHLFPPPHSGKPLHSTQVKLTRTAPILPMPPNAQDARNFPREGERTREPVRLTGLAPILRDAP